MNILLSRHRKYAFTLIELLLVITIIALLGALLLPALAQGKRAATATECRNNLRTIGLAMSMYVNDFHYYPRAYYGGIMGAGPEYGWLMLDDWKETLVPFIGVQSDNFVRRYSIMRTLRCPQVVSNEDGKRGNGQYACNASGTAEPGSTNNLGLGGFPRMGRFYHTSESAVRAPADMVAVGDVMPGSTLNEMFTTSGRFDICTTNRSFWPGSSHNRQGNMVFADGHVESAKQSAWISTNYAARARWNNDHEPHPETWGR